MLKPDAVARKLQKQIFERVKNAGLKVVRERELSVDAESAAKLYKVHMGRPFYPGLINFITSGPVLATIVEGDNAILTIRDLMGNTDPRKAAPGTIRGDLSDGDILTSDGTIKNLVHGSDSLESARYEIPILFPDWKA
ncbi:MAG: nucleoside-diphosphate kinase [Candidatus Saganbacteria bacterium]|nr:nucleoside-diphosphate kinase [Candidatus Saganbacteria bacterium]